MRRSALLQLGLLAVVAAAITTAVAVFIPWLPIEGSKEAERIAFTFWFMTWVSIFVFAGVAAVLVYAAWKFRVKEGDLSDGPPVHGHSGLEIAWTVIPFLLVTAVAIVSAVVLHQNTRTAPNQLKITATGEQFFWTFKYPNGKVYPNLRVPLGRQVLFTLVGRDVLHGFWVPQWWQKNDVVPGLDTHIGVTPTVVGTFPVVCIELCGLGHSIMRSEAIVMEEADYDAWYAAASEPEPEGNPDQAALATWEENGCGGCHTFTAAKSNGAIGPNLDNLKQQAARAGQPVLDFTTAALTDPNGYIEPGYQSGVMPADYVSSIPVDKMNELIKYLVDNTK